MREDYEREKEKSETYSYRERAEMREREKAIERVIKRQRVSDSESLTWKERG